MDRLTHFAGLIAVILCGCAVPKAIGELPPAATSTSTGGPTSTSSTTASSETESTTTMGTTTGGMIGPGPMRAYAMRFDELPGDETAGDGTASDVGGSTTGGPFAPDAILVTITTGQDTCDDPFAPLQCGIAWNVSFNIPPQMQVPGTYQLFPDFNGTSAATGEVDAGECSFGGGSLDGTVIIDEIDDTHVAGRLEDTDALDFDANVSFDAARCVF